MKKLIIRDHLMNIVLEKDIYMEGQDFIYIAPQPEAIWLKELYICSPEDTDKFVLTDEEVAERQPKLELELESPTEEQKVRMWENIEAGVTKKGVEPEKPDRPVKCLSCGWTGSTKDCQFGHNDFYCPECGKENLEEVKPDEPKAVSDKSAGDKGSGETEQSPSPEAASTKPAKRKTPKRSS